MNVFNYLMLDIALIYFVSETVAIQEYGVYHENDIPKIIFTHSPSTEMMFSSLHPKANLYTKPMSNRKAQENHGTMRDALKATNATVYTIREALLFNTNSSKSKELEDLRELASKYLIYDTDNLRMELSSSKKFALRSLGSNKSEQFRKQLKEIEPKLSKEYQEKYRKQVLEFLPPETLVDIILQRPIVELHLRHWTIDDEEFVNLESDIIVKPLGNLYFMRDQQLTTQKGIVMLRSHLRNGEAEVTKFVWKKMGIPVVCKVTKGFAEGGEFIPAGDLVFFGQGVRTSMSAIEELMENDCFGANEVAVVRDYGDFDNDRMHLDTFFNILDGKGNVLMLQDILTKYKRYVDLYSKKGNKERISDSKPCGPYSLVSRKVEFGQFLKSRGFKVTTVTNEEQLKFALNFLNLGNGTILTPYGEKSYVTKLENLGINVHVLRLPHLLAGNGGVHCMTQVVYRQRASNTKIESKEDSKEGENENASESKEKPRSIEEAQEEDE